MLCNTLSTTALLVVDPEMIMIKNSENRARGAVNLAEPFTFTIRLLAGWARKYIITKKNLVEK